jgi:hypothetical protein
VSKLTREINEADSSQSVGCQLRYVMLISDQLRQCLINFDFFFEIFSTCLGGEKIVHPMSAATQLTLDRLPSLTPEPVPSPSVPSLKT